MRKSRAKKEMSELIDSLEEQIIRHKKLTWIRVPLKDKRDIPRFRVLTFYDENGEFSSDKVESFIEFLRDMSSQVIDQAYKDKVNIKDRSSLKYLLGLIVDQIFEDLHSETSC